MIADFQWYLGDPPAGWDATIRELGGTVFHSSVWAEYQRSRYHADPVFFEARDETGSMCGGAVGLFRKSRVRFLDSFVRELSLFAHPIVRQRDGSVAVQFAARFEEAARELRCSRVAINSFMSGVSPFVPAQHGYTEHHRVEFRLDLRQDTDALWRGIRKDQRARIKRLEREGVTYDPEGGRDDLEDLRMVRESAHARRLRRGEEYELSADEGFYGALLEHLVKGDAGQLFVARRAGEVLAALFFAKFNGSAYSVFSGSTDLGYKVGAQSGLFWAAVQTFKSAGFRELNRGGVPASAEKDDDPLHGIYRFKIRLGTTPVTCRSGEKVLNRLQDGLAQLWLWLRQAYG